jgi:hypothetical protein
VAAQVLRTGAAAAVPEEPGERIGAAQLQLATEDVALAHAASIAQTRAKAHRPQGSCMGNVAVGRLAQLALVLFRRRRAAPM